jgi:ADP-heptose:LPS heptosyltransferase
LTGFPRTGSFAAVVAMVAASASGPILFVAGNRLGDVVLASGMLARLIENRPTAAVTIACGALPAPLFADVPNLERIIVMRKAPFAGHWLSLWSSVAARRWDTVADLRGSMLAWTLMARRRLAAHAEHRREHRVEELGRLFGFDPPPAPKLWVAPARAARIAAQLGDGPPILAVAPAANWVGKQWPADRFAETVRRLTGPGGAMDGARVLVSAAAHERAAAQPVLDAVPASRRLDWIGAQDLLDLGAAFAHCRLFIGNDSGLMHLAAAAGTPTLGLFGPSPEWRYGPWGAKAALVRTRESYDEIIARPGFSFKSRDGQMGSLTVDAVVEAAEALLARS